MSQRQRIVLVCHECGGRNYQTTRSRVVSPTSTRLELKKFCKTCKKHTVHREAK